MPCSFRSSSAEVEDDEDDEDDDEDGIAGGVTTDVSAPVGAVAVLIPVVDGNASGRL